MGLILVPTRELAFQVDETIRKLTPVFKMRSIVLVGGQKMGPQISGLRNRPHVIIATPGRLYDHLGRNTAKLNTVNMLVLDEADRMLDMGFLPQIEKIMKYVPKDRQTMLFSATMPEGIVKIVTSYMKLPVRTEIAPPGTAPELITQEIFVVKSENKQKTLKEILKKYTGSVLLFTRTKRGAAKINRFLRDAGFSSAEIHSDRSMGQRKEALQGFKSGRFRILAATDIAARGIDVTGIELVVNYDIPDDPENYVHRIGRTGRAGLKGHAVSLATPDQGDDVKAIEKIIKTAIPLAAYPDLPVEKFIRSSPAFSSSRRRRGRFVKFIR